MSFVWIPGTPLDDAALDRLKHHFPKPSEPPHEGWFMGVKQNYYTWVVDTDPTEVDYRSIETYLIDSSIGIKSFPNAENAQRQWRDTYSYLLPYLLPLYSEQYLLSDLISYFMLLYPDDIPSLYSGFRRDILNTLGSMILGPVFWEGKDLSKALRKRDRDYWHSYGTTDFYSLISPAIYFCLKYLSPQEVLTWCNSMVQIEGAHWHYHLLNWLYEETFHLMFHFEKAELPDTKVIQPKGRLGSNVQVDNFSIPSDNMRMFFKMLEEHGIYYP